MNVDFLSLFLKKINDLAKFSGYNSQVMDDESSSEINSLNNGLILSDFFFPSEIIVNFLVFIDWRDLLSCRLVCKSWKKLIDGVVGIEKLKRFCYTSLKSSFTHHLPYYSSENLPFCAIFAIQAGAFGKNHLKNGFGSGEVPHSCERPRNNDWREVSGNLKLCSNGDCPRYKHWAVTSSGGDGWIVETIPSGSEPLPEHLEGRSCFTTSYRKCSKKQCIILAKCGLTRKIMDDIQPHIEVSEWYAKRWDCGIKYELTVSLLNEKKRVVDSFNKRIEDRDGDNNWHQVSHIFKAYGPGIRYVMFEHEGTDTQFWAGFYGAKMAGGSVIARIPIEVLGQICDSN